MVSFVMMVGDVLADHLDKPKRFVEESDLNVRAGRIF
jgi:hypothetical protein